MHEANSPLSEVQRQHWDETYELHPGMYGTGPPQAAIATTELFTNHRVMTVLELGGAWGVAVRGQLP